MNYFEIEQAFLEKQYAAVPFSVARFELEELIRKFTTFLELPDEQKCKIAAEINPSGVSPEELGYIRREKKGGHLDSKEFFHFNDEASRLFSALPESNLPAVRELLAACRPVYEAAKKIVQDAIILFDKEYPGVANHFLVPDNVSTYFLRVLKYNRAEKGDFLAAGHYDRCVLTLAIAESAPGLRIGTNASTVRPVEHQPGTALLFPAYGLQMCTDKIFVPAWHDVVQKSDDSYDKKTARWAIVLFAHAPDLSKLTVDKAYAQMTM